MPSATSQAPNGGAPRWGHRCEPLAACAMRMLASGCNFSHPAHHPSIPPIEPRLAHAPLDALKQVVVTSAHVFQKRGPSQVSSAWGGRQPLVLLTGACLGARWVFDTRGVAADPPRRERAANRDTAGTRA